MDIENGSNWRPTRSQVVELLSRLVSIDSVNPSLVPGAAGEAQIAHFVGEWLQRAGLTVEYVEPLAGRPTVVARLAGRSVSNSTLMLNAHIDTVGVAGMQDPFDPRVNANRLYGRGAYDMKGSLAAIMLAVQHLAATGGTSVDVLVTAVADEEYASFGTEAVLERWTADAAVVTEPTGLRLCTAHKGFAWIKIETAGCAAHGSKPDLGVDAIAHMGRVLQDIETLGDRLSAAQGHALLGSGSIHASLITGGQELSSYPDRCRLQIERRTIPGESSVSVMAEIDEILASRRSQDTRFSATAEMTFWRDPFEVARDADIVTTIALASQHAVGRAPDVYGDTPWMDAALLSAAGIPTVVYGPGGGGAHALVEYSELDEVAECAAVLAYTARIFGSRS